MTGRTLVSLAVALALAAGGVAFAQGRGNRGGEERRDNNDRGPGPGQGERDMRGDDRRGNNGRGPPGRMDERARFEQRGERGAGPDHNFYRGGRLPDYYRHRQYVVDDWRGHDLSAPPRGYHWVQTGGDYVLVAIASGIIAQLLLGR
jgi:Ni/Co efflux regulator RcnB